MAHSTGVRKLLEEQTDQIIDDAIDLIISRARYAGVGGGNGALNINPEELREKLFQGLERAKDESPTVSVVFKDVTYEQTQNKDFREQLNKSLPTAVRKRLGAWTEQFDAAKALPSRPMTVRYYTYINQELNWTKSFLEHPNIVGFCVYTGRIRPCV